MLNANHVLLTLRNQTRDLHEALESMPLFSRLMASDVTIDDYALALTALRYSYTAFETELLQTLQHYAPAYRYIARLPLLDHDLSKLGADTSLIGAAEKSHFATIPVVLGALYVAEGSTLGGKILVNRLKTNLGAALTYASSFYTLGGQLENHNWAATQNLLCEYLNSADELEQAVESARQTFSLFISGAEFYQVLTAAA